MRKIIFPLLVIFVLCFTSCVFGATKQDVINAINATYPVGDSSYRLPQSVINKGVNAINSRDLTPQQCDRILGMIGRAVAVAQHAGTTDITKVSKEDIQAGISIIREATGAAKMDLGLSIPKIDNNTGANSSNSNGNGQSSPSSDAVGTDLQSGEQRSGDLLSGDVTSGDASNEEVFNILSFFMDSSGDDAKEIEQTVETHSTIAIIVLILILFLNIFIIYLLFRSKWNKIAKCILIIIFVILFLSTLFVLCVGLYYIEELKMIYKLYYMLK